MKSLLTVIAILLSVATFGQLSLTSNPVQFSTGKNNFIYDDAPMMTTESNQIFIGSKKKPIPTSTSLYTFHLNGQAQTQRSGDTLTVLDKQIRFIVVDGVTYEIVRTTELKESNKPLQFPSNIPFYNGGILNQNGITLTPNYFRSN